MKAKINLAMSKAQITKQLSNMHAVDIARELYLLEFDERKELIQLIPVNKVDDVFIELDATDALEFFSLLSLEKQQVLLKDLSAADLKDLFEEFDEESKEQFVELLEKPKKNELLKLMKYDQTQAASEMRSDYLTIDYNQIVSEAMKDIISKVVENDFIDTIFVVKGKKLVGIIELKDLIIARKNDEISELVNMEYEFVYEDDKLGEAISAISNYDINVLPVISHKNELLGIITADDVLEEMALEYEANVDKFVAVGDFDEDSRPLKRATQRLPWLLVSIVLNLVIALFLSIFSGTIETVAALILFQPLILGMAGNIGTQAIAVTILILHKKTHETKEAMKKHVRKEVLIGILNALLVGVFGFFLSWGFLSFTTFNQSGNVSAVFLSLTIGLALFFSMLLSALFGVMIPIVLTKFKIDPAAASGPVISTINDLVALLIYFGLATLIIIPMVS